MMFAKHSPLFFALAWSVLLTFPSASALGQDAGTGVPAGEYTLDKSHSTVVFRVSHLGFSFYTASFSRFDAALNFDPDQFTEAVLTATIEVASLVLPSPPEGFLDELLGPDWLDAQKYPVMTYRSTGVKKTGDTSARVTGDLTFRGVTRPVVLDVTFNGGYRGLAGFDPQARAGFSAHGSLQRSDFKLSNGLPPEGTSMGVFDAVDFIIETEFTGPPLQE